MKADGHLICVNLDARTAATSFILEMRLHPIRCSGG
jgi:hypothetical protein